MRGCETQAWKDSQFKKGKSGNPKGRPKRQSLEQLVEAYLAKKSKKPPEDGPAKTQTRLAELAVVIGEGLLAGDSFMINLYASREWPVVNVHEVRVPGAEPGELVDGISAHAKRVRTNGSGGKSLPASTSGNGGVAE